MKNLKFKKASVAALITLALTGTMFSFAGCSDNSSDETTTAAETTEATTTEAEVSEETTTEAETSEETSVSEDEGTGLKDGDRFQGTIMIEGMEEQVNYEHVIDKKIGVELDYEYEYLAKSSENDTLVFTSVYDDAENPRNYLEISFSPETDISLIEAYSPELAKDYEEVTATDFQNASSTDVPTQLDAFVSKGEAEPADSLQRIYIIPVDGGCIVGVAHFTVESAEGFGNRFGTIMRSLVVTDR